LSSCLGTSQESSMLKQLEDDLNATAGDF